jgi:hypothetical protein
MQQLQLVGLRLAVPTMQQLQLVGLRLVVPTMQLLQLVGLRLAVPTMQLLQLVGLRLAVPTMQQLQAGGVEACGANNAAAASCELGMSAGATTDMAAAGNCEAVPGHPPDPFAAQVYSDASQMLTGAISEMVTMSEQGRSH